MSRQRPEHRRHKRLRLACPVTVCQSDGQDIGRTRTLNVSNGGALVSLPVDRLPPCGCELRLTVSVPRSTPNTYMLEEFRSGATVVRHQALVDERRAGVAVRFTQPLELALEV
jgi:hypothetical protein